MRRRQTNYRVFDVNALGKRTLVHTTGQAMLDAYPTLGGRPYTREYGYNARGEVTSSDVEDLFGNDVTAHLRGYQYDGIGNRERSIDGDTDPQQAGAITYTPDNLNQYDDIIGTINPVYDEDGNLTEGPLPANLSQLHDLEWDGENRLVRVSITGGSTTTYTYDAFGRRTVSRTGSTRTYTLWDGWNPLGEWTGPNHTSGTAPSLTEVHTWLWGLDISGTLDGAGGVGGLLADELHTGNSGLYYPLYDGNGNVTQYLASSGGLAAHFEYDPFGNLAVPAHENGALTGIADELPFKFSTKYEEPTSGLYYYGYRFYEPGTGRWPSRDPIEERGGVNLYGFVGNDGVNGADLLGLCKRTQVCKVRIVFGHGNVITEPGDPEVPTTIHEHQQLADELEGRKQCGKNVYVGCGANGVNEDAQDSGHGVPNPPTNDQPYPPDYGTRDGIDRTDCLAEEQIPERLGQAWNSAAEQARSFCGECKPCCCKKVLIKVVCLGSAQDDILTDRVSNYLNRNCGRTYEWSCN